MFNISNLIDRVVGRVEICLDSNESEGATSDSLEPIEHTEWEMVRELVALVLRSAIDNGARSIWFKLDKENERIRMFHYLPDVEVKWPGIDGQHVKHEVTSSSKAHQRGATYRGSPSAGIGPGWRELRPLNRDMFELLVDVFRWFAGIPDFSHRGRLKIRTDSGIWRPKVFIGLHDIFVSSEPENVSEPETVS